MAKDQLPRSKISQVLSQLGLSELVSKAREGHPGSLIKLARMAEADPQVREALNMLLPRRNPANAKRREWVSKVEHAGALSNGKVRFVQGGSPGLKKK